MLKAGALPKVYYLMALGRITISDTRKGDKIERAFVRQWMARLNDISIDFFHSLVSEGGLGIPSLRWLAPLHRKDRLLGLVPRTSGAYVLDTPKTPFNLFSLSNALDKGYKQSADSNMSIFKDINGDVEAMAEREDNTATQKKKNFLT